MRKCHDAESCRAAELHAKVAAASPTIGIYLYVAGGRGAGAKGGGAGGVLSLGMVVVSITIMVAAKKQTNKRYLGCLAHAVIGMFYNAAANQRQSQYTCNYLQRRCQPRPTMICILYIVSAGGGGGRAEGGHPAQEPEVWIWPSSS